MNEAANKGEPKDERDDILPPIMGLSDIVRRWTVTRETVRLWMKQDPKFPRPIGSINGGRNRIWLKADIERYEWGHPILLEPRDYRRSPKAVFDLHELGRQIRGTDD